MKQYAVRAVHCDHQANDEAVYEALARVTAPLGRSWEKLAAAKLIALKANVVWPPDNIRMFKGQRQELVADSVFRATLRLLRERTTARLVLVDTTQMYNPESLGQDVYFLPLLDEYGVEYVEFNHPPLKTYDVPGGGLMFQRYLMGAVLSEADAIVSVAKMKNHGFMGVTLCLKNLFGLPTMPPHGRPRTYFHHVIRLPYILADLGLIARPCLNIVDGLVGQARREWGGEPRVADTLVAGDHVIATDACATQLMGHDPASDWPTPPFRRDRNPLRVAVDHGFGTVDLNEIDFESEVQPPVAEFDSDEVDSPETVANWRRTTCEQGLYYQEHRDELVDRYKGSYLFLQDGVALWNGPDPHNLGSRRGLSGQRKDSALWLKWVDPDEEEGENFEVYSEELRRMQETADA